MDKVLSTNNQLTYTRKRIFSAFIHFVIYVFHPFVLAVIYFEKDLILSSFFIFTWVFSIGLKIAFTKNISFALIGRLYSLLAIGMFIFNYCYRGGFFKTSVAWFPVIAMMVIVFLERPKERHFALIATTLLVLLAEYICQKGFFPAPDFKSDIYNKNLVSSAVLSFTLIGYTLHKFLLHLEFFIKKFKENFEMKEVLLSVLYHDISTPLTTIMISANIETEEARKRVNISANNIRDIIDNVRNLQRLSLGKMDPNIEEIPLSDCLNQAIQRLSLAMESKNIKFNTYMQDPHYIVKVNPLLFTSSVLNNVFHNAVKFSEDGSVIDVSVKPEANHICLSIQDYGTGIPNELRETVFQLRSKVSTKGTKLEMGSGFGLPIAKSLLELWGGKIFIPRSDKGTCIIIHLKGYVYEEEQKKDIVC